MRQSRNYLWEHNYGNKISYKTWNLKKTNEYFISEMIFFSRFRSFTLWKQPHAEDFLHNRGFGFADVICQGGVSVGLPRHPWCGAKRTRPLSHQWVYGHMLEQCTSLALGQRCLQPPQDGRRSSAFPRLQTVKEFQISSFLSRTRMTRHLKMMVIA